MIRTLITFSRDVLSSCERYNDCFVHFEMDFKITNVIALAFISINLFIPFIPTRVFSQLSYSGLEGILLNNKSHVFDYELSKTRCFQTRFSHHFSPNFFFRRSTLSIVEKIVSFFRIVFNCTCFELKLERTEFVPRKRTQDDGWQSGREPFVRLSKSRKCGNANNPRIVKVCLKAKRRF